MNYEGFINFIELLFKFSTRPRFFLENCQICYFLTQSISRGGRALFTKMIVAVVIFTKNFGEQHYGPIFRNMKIHPNDSDINIYVEKHHTYRTYKIRWLVLLISCLLTSSNCVVSQRASRFSKKILYFQQWIFYSTLKGQTNQYYGLNVTVFDEPEYFTTQIFQVLIILIYLNSS